MHKWELCLGLRNLEVPYRLWGQQCRARGVLDTAACRHRSNGQLVMVKYVDYALFAIKVWHLASKRAWNMAG